MLLALSLLTKETYAICAWVPLVDLRNTPYAVWRGIAHASVIILPFLLWAIYVRSRFQMHSYDAINFAWPFEGWIYGIISLVAHAKVFAVFGAFSLLGQLVYLALWPRFNSFYWRAAISFGIASCFLSDDPFGSDVSFTRDLLPTTIGFNVLLMRESPVNFPVWFVAGNIGLFSGLVGLIQKML